MALALAAAGIYGVVSYAVRRRTREIGIRIALGAGRWDTLRLVSGRVMAMVLLGVAGGVAGSFLLREFLDKQLFQVSAADPAVSAAAALTLILIALAACYIPARRAAKVDPMTALRYE